ncbi:sterol 3-beta-glucosyltransferase [Scheffersomyces coipomensis]|uniref:sterol 3-beta-glucosyltransferase n=1 Tax=Scheffersomyces coipomensis TaxID=1788519 RepID=UPI00315C6B0E
MSESFSSGSGDGKGYSLHPYNPDKFSSGAPVPDVSDQHSAVDTITSNTTATSTLHRTTLQQSFIDNLNQHSIKEGLLIKRIDHPDMEKIDDSLYKEQKENLCLNIADKLQKVFELSDDDYFYGNFNSWLIKDVLLQGHLYLTKQCIIFFAFLPKKESVTSDIGQDDSQNIIQAGSLGLKSAKYVESVFTTVITHRFWAILRSETLSIYSSSTDLYFPSLVIDLRTCIKAEIIDKDKMDPIKSPTSRSRADTGSGMMSPRLTTRNSTEFLTEDDFQSVLTQENLSATEDNEGLTNGVWVRLVTQKKTYRFLCDNLFSARQWCNNLTKVIFQLNNSNESNEVLIKIPIENVLDYGKNELFEMDSEPDEQQPISISIKYIDKNRVKKSKFKKSDANEDMRLKSIYFVFFHDTGIAFEALSKVVNDFRRRKSSVDIDDAASLTSSTSKSERIIEKAKRMVGKDDSNISISDSALKKIGKSLSNTGKMFNNRKLSDSIHSVSSTMNSSIFDSGTMGTSTSLSTSASRVSMPKPLSVQGIRDLQMSFETKHLRLEDAVSLYKERSKNSAKSDSIQSKLIKMSIGKSIKLISNVGNKWTAPVAHYVKISENDPNYVTDKKERDESQIHFREHFSLNDDKKLVATYYGHLLRSIPVYGKLYLGETELCFRSLLPGVSTKMILPLGVVETCYRERGINLTYSGLVVVIKGREKLFLEFGSQKARDDGEEMLLKQLEKLHKDESWSPTPIEWGHNYDLELNRVRLGGALTPADESDESDEEDDIPNSNVRLAEARIESARLKMFEDKFNAASGIDIPLILEDSPFAKIEIRPSTSYKFTLLTIGSRGDVQPYIALGKGLKKEGHIVTIATHKEFEPWIRKHGMEFKEIAGDPGELMSLMVSHGSMSVSFLKEASSRLRGWITKLLTSSWEACQGSDILIESPSAMGGVHIAEALGIPYMRDFTMPWTRTRAYPHAFIVPDQKKGGSYNYLTHVMFETVFWKGISSQVNKWRIKELDLPRTNLLRMSQTRIPFLYNVSPSIFPPSVDFPDWVKVTGYWFLDEGAAKDYNPPDALVEFLESAIEEEKKIVYIGFGSIVVKDAKSLTKAIVDAVLEADVRCILNKGWSDRMSQDKNEPEIELPPEIYNSGSIPHDWLFPKIDAAVHHGGSGTTGATLRWGTPTIIKPFFGDQFFYASRVEELGVGIALRKLNSRSLAKAMINATTDLKMIAKSKRLSEQIKNECGVLSAIEAIYSEMEYARSLIAAKQQYNEHYKLHHPDFKSSGLHTPVANDIEHDDEDEEEEDDDYDDENAVEDDSETEEEDNIDKKDAIANEYGVSLVEPSKQSLASDHSTIISR